MHGRGGLGDFPFPTTFVFVSWWRGNCSFPICWRGRSVMGTLTGARESRFPTWRSGIHTSCCRALAAFPCVCSTCQLDPAQPLPPIDAPTPKRGVHCPCLRSGLLYPDATLLLFFPVFYYYYFLILTVELESNARRRRRFAERAVGCVLQLCVSATEQMLRLHPRGDQGLEARPVLAAW